MSPTKISLKSSISTKSGSPSSINGNPPVMNAQELISSIEGSGSTESSSQAERNSPRGHRVFDARRAMSSL